MGKEKLEELKKEAKNIQGITALMEFWGEKIRKGQVRPNDIPWIGVAGHPQTKKGTETPVPVRIFDISHDKNVKGTETIPISP